MSGPKQQSMEGKKESDIRALSNVKDLKSRVMSIRQLRLLGEGDSDTDPADRELQRIKLFKSQRRYKWKWKLQDNDAIQQDQNSNSLASGLVEDVLQAFKDTKEDSEENRGYFLNTISYFSQNTNEKVATLYDGQQRVVTMSLLLTAVFKRCLHYSDSILRKTKSSVPADSVSESGHVFQNLSNWCGGLGITNTEATIKDIGDTEELREISGWNKHKKGLEFDPSVDLKVPANVSEADAFEGLINTIMDGDSEENDSEDDSNSLILRNFKEIEKSVEQLEESNQEVEKKLEALLKLAKFILDNVIFIAVEFPADRVSEADAGNFFRVFNQPALPLTEFEVFHSWLLGMIPKPNKDVEKAFEVFESFRRNDFLHHDCFMNVMSLTLKTSPRLNDETISDIWKKSPSLTAQYFFHGIRKDDKVELKKQFIVDLSVLLKTFKEEFIDQKGRGYLLATLLNIIDQIKVGDMQQEVYIITAALLSFLYSPTSGKTSDPGVQCRFLSPPGSSEAIFTAVKKYGKKGKGKEKIWPHVERKIILLCFTNRKQGKKKEKGLLLKELDKLLRDIQTYTKLEPQKQKDHKGLTDEVKDDMKKISNELSQEKLYTGLLKYSTQKRIFNYLLFSLEDFYSKDNKWWKSKLSQYRENFGFHIDHIRPKSKENTKTELKDSLGNLTVLTGAANITIGSKDDIAEKFKYLFKTNGNAQWTPWLLKELWKKFPGANLDGLSSKELENLEDKTLEDREKRLLCHIRDYIIRGLDKKVQRELIGELDTGAAGTSASGKSKSKKGKKNEKGEMPKVVQQQEATSVPSKLSHADAPAKETRTRRRRDMDELTPLSDDMKEELTSLVDKAEKFFKALYWYCKEEAREKRQLKREDCLEKEISYLRELTGFVEGAKKGSHINLDKANEFENRFKEAQTVVNYNVFDFVKLTESSLKFWDLFCELLPATPQTQTQVAETIRNFQNRFLKKRK